MKNTNETEVKENKVAKWFKNMLNKLGIGKKQKRLAAPSVEKKREYFDVPTTVHKNYDKRNEFVESLRGKEEVKEEQKNKRSLFTKNRSCKYLWPIYWKDCRRVQQRKWKSYYTRRFRVYTDVS